MRYEFGGLIFGGAYPWRGLFSEFYGISIAKTGTTEQRETFNVAKYIRLEQIVFFRASAVLKN